VENNLAVLIDFENIAAGTEKEGLGRFDVDALMQRIKEKGRILLSRSYADWGRFSRFKQSLLTANVTMMELTSHGMQDKNRADIAMVVDALELAFTKDYIHTYVVVSGDSDFTPLVLKMRELNKRVIGVGTRRSTSRLLVQACDEFIFYDAIIGRTSSRPPARGRRRPKSDGPMSRDTAFERVVDAIEGLQRENSEPPLASVVKSALLRKSPDFSETDLGFPSFARFLEAAQTASLVRIVRDRKSGGYRVESTVEQGRNKNTARNAKTLTWEDPYVPEAAQKYVEYLAGNGLHPLGSPTRKSLLEALESVVTERKKRRRKVTVQFVKDDIKKHLRTTHPDLPVQNVQAVLEALLRGGHLIHRDGTAIRSPSAPFGIEKDAEQLNEALVSVYLRQLLIGGHGGADVSVLAELFYGDADRRRDIEESLAWLAAEVPESEKAAAGHADDGDLDLDLDLDLDALLEPEGTFESATATDVLEVSAEPVEAKAETVEAAAETAEATSKSEPAESSDADGADTAELEAKPAAKKTVAKKTAAKKTVAKKTAAKKTVAKKPAAKKTVAKKTAAKKTVAKKTVAKKTVAKKTVAKKAESSESETVDSTEPEKPIRKRRRTRKKVEAAPTTDDSAVGIDELDALLDMD
jgi:hypothetical protein